MVKLLISVGERVVAAVPIGDPELSVTDIEIFNLTSLVLVTREKVSDCSSVKFSFLTKVYVRDEVGEVTMSAFSDTLAPELNERVEGGPQLYPDLYFLLLPSS